MFGGHRRWFLGDELADSAAAPDVRSAEPTA
jgi:hypothetical protein